jgi:hypothetical protein
LKKLPDHYKELQLVTGKKITIVCKSDIIFINFLNISFMKKLITYLTVFAITGLVSCGEDEHEISASAVPQPVMSAFQAKYPNVTPEKWIREKEKGKMVYEAKFTSNNKKMEADFDENGSLVEEE